MSFETGSKESNYKIKLSRESNPQNNRLRIALIQLLNNNKEGAKIGLLLGNKSKKLFIQDFYKFSFEKAAIMHAKLKPASAEQPSDDNHITNAHDDQKLSESSKKPTFLDRLRELPVASTITFDINNDGSFSFDSVSLSTKDGDTSIEDYANRLAQEGKGDISDTELSSLIALGAIDMINLFKQAIADTQDQRARAIQKEVARLRKERGLEPSAAAKNEALKEELLNNAEEQVYNLCARLYASRGHRYSDPA
jgi:hypothetical protein